jgi:ATP-dependent Lon protease
MANYTQDQINAWVSKKMQKEEKEVQIENKVKTTSQEVAQKQKEIDDLQKDRDSVVSNIIEDIKKIV